MPEYSVELYEHAGIVEIAREHKRNVLSFQ